MATVDVPATPTIRTLADLQRRLGDVSPDRILFRPFPGTGTRQDVLEVHRLDGRLCELVEGVLLEKVVGYQESRLAVFLSGLLNAFVIPRNLGVVSGEAGAVELMSGLVRMPDVSFASWDRFPGRRNSGEPIPDLVPDLAVEVLSRSNTPGEVAVKRQDYFAAGVRLVWEIDPQSRTATVYTSPIQSTIVGPSDALTGDPVLPGFALPLQQLFAELDRQG
jgi:Uma2 family endonuclease